MGARRDSVTAHALCRCGEHGGTAACPVHGQGNPTRTVALSHQPLPPLRCALCGQELSARWNRGATLEPDDKYLAVMPHRCSTDDVRVVDASDLSDDELLAAVRARGLAAG
jgi:hypothetical protein